MGDDAQALARIKKTATDRLDAVNKAKAAKKATADVLKHHAHMDALEDQHAFAVDDDDDDDDDADDTPVMPRQASVLREEATARALRESQAALAKANAEIQALRERDRYD
jgi:hypothetical protein